MTRRGLAVVISVVIVLAAAGFAFFLYQSDRGSPQTQKAAQTEGDVITIYFPGEGGKLQKKAVEVHKQPSDMAKAETLFRELKEARCIPDRLKIHEMALSSDNVLYLNISAEFIDRNTPDKETTMTYGIVNSFIESFHNVKRVQILV